MTGIVLNPVGANNPISTNLITPTMGRGSEWIASELHGKWATAGLNKGVFAFNVTAVTVPVIASNLVSVYSLWNPPSSNTLAEMIDTEIGQVVAATVVDAVGWYINAGSTALAGTFTTKAVPMGQTTPTYFSMRVGEVPNGQIIPYTAYTHSGSPARVDIIGSYGATTDASFFSPQKMYDGRLWIPPGTVMSIAMSTGAGTGSGLDLSSRWAEWPFV